MDLTPPLLNENLLSEDTPYSVKNFHQNEDASFYVYKKCIISDAVRRNEIWETYMHNVFEKYITKDSVVIDGGCHIGTHSVKLSKLAKKVYCFEPLPPSNELLKKNLQLNNCDNVEVFDCGLSDTFETANFGWIQVNNPGASFLDKNPMGLPDNSHNLDQNSEVNLITIDSLNLDQLDFIKLDVEGYEPKAINGGLNTIKKLKPIIIVECWANHSGGVDQAHTEKIFEVLFDIGYRMERVSHCDWLFIPA
jgi:FkbM family methyltransferase